MRKLTEKQQTAYDMLLEKPRSYWANKRQPVGSQVRIQMLVMEQLVKKGFATSIMEEVEYSECKTKNFNLNLTYDRRVIFTANPPRCGLSDT